MLFLSLFMLTFRSTILHIKVSIVYFKVSIVHLEYYPQESLCSVSCFSPVSITHHYSDSPSFLKGSITAWRLASPSAYCPRRLPPQARLLILPIQTSPNCPLPSFLMSCSDSRGISHTSLVLTDRSASLGMPRWQLPTRRQQRPAARSDR